ncbi:MAG: membrane protein insertase YidC [Pseudomonadota bacterium]
MDDNNKNLILASALSFLVILVWFLIFPPQTPEQPVQQADGQTQTLAPGESATPPAGATTTSAAPVLTADEAQSRDAALAQSERINIVTNRLQGSISLTGGRIDDLKLLDYNERLNDESEKVRLLSPAGGPEAYYALHGWIPQNGLTYDDVPTARTEWTQIGGNALSFDSPVELEWTNPAGLTFRKTISVDEDFLFTITQSIQNSSDTALRLAPYGIVARKGEPETIGMWLLHEGVVRASDGTIQEIDYDDMPDQDFVQTEAGNVDSIEVSENGWIGFTSKYWMTTLLPEPGQPFASVSKYVPSNDTYQVEMRLPSLDIPAGETVSTTTHVFAGAKEYEAIRNYEAGREIDTVGGSLAYAMGFGDSNGFESFLDSIDWGWFFFLTKPIFWVLHELNILIGNMGWAIIGLTLVIKAVLFPLAYKSYVSMARMKELQPEMEKLKEKHGEDRQAMQMDVVALYKEKKVNPAAGCLPILLQIPIFFSLYKVIFVTLELRHAPFIGWLEDLSAPDPTSWLNLFGLLPYATPAPESLFYIFSIGVWPIAFGVSMWLQQKLNPAPPDPTQQMIFAWMPWVFMFMLGSFASGLIVYWVANNVITFIQQYTIMRSQGVKPDILGNIRAQFKKEKES